MPAPLPPAVHRQRSDLLRMRQLLWVLLAIELFFLLALLVGAWALNVRALLYASLTLAGFTAVTGIALRALRRAEPARSALTMAIALLAFSLVHAHASPWAMPVLLIVPPLAVAMVLPYVSGRRLYLFVASALSAEAALPIITWLNPDDGGLPPLLQISLVVGGLVTASGLLVVILVQFSRRVRHALRDALTANQRLQILAAENERLLAQAQQAVKARDDFLAVAGHELKTPLAALRLQIQGLLRPSHTIPAEVAPKLERVVRHTQRLDRLITELLDVSRLAAGRLALGNEQVDLVVLLHEVAERFKEEADRTGTELKITAPATLPVNLDRLRVDQVMTNLISNALKYGAGKPVALQLTSDQDAWARFEVRDKGIGIPPEAQSRIFGRFERAVSDRHYGGLGLGLWLSNELVHAMSGTISFESAPGAGTTFVVRLPRSQEPAAPLRQTG